MNFQDFKSKTSLMFNPQDRDYTKMLRNNQLRHKTNLCDKCSLLSHLFELLK